MLDALKPLPPDPILGVITAHDNDPNPNKVDLGAGVYKTAEGLTPVFAAVHEAEQRVLAAQDSKTYIAPPGDPAFIQGVIGLVFGPDHPAVAEGRVAGVQAPGGSGSLRLGAQLLLRAKADTRMWVSTPTWGNHIPLMGSAGLTLEQYPYYDFASHSIDFESMVTELKNLGPGDVALLHACCHNPSGADLTVEQWDVVGDMAVEQGFTPFVDFAYHGLGEGMDEDAYGPRMLARRVPELLVAYSCSKNFGLYRERTGLAIAVTTTPTESATARSQLNNIARELYSMPPAHGASIVGEILKDAALTGSWREELAGMRNRINGLRTLLADHLRTATGTSQFDFIAGERGMFSFLGLSPEQVTRLQTEFSVYPIGSSRINIAGINDKNVAYVAEAVAAVL